MKKIIIFMFVFILLFNTIVYAASYSNSRHAVSIDFGTTIFSMVTLPQIGNLIFQPQYGEKLIKSAFGLRFGYNYKYLPKQSIDVTFGFYVFSSHYGSQNVQDIIGMQNMTKFYNADAAAIPASIGVRFYFNKRDRDNGFFLLPKVGMTVFTVNGRELMADGTEKPKSYSAIANFYISGEMGFKIDMFTKMGSDWPVRPFIDISLLDLGYSFTHGLRFVPLPRLAIGLAF